MLLQQRCLQEQEERQKQISQLAQLGMHLDGSYYAYLNQIATRDRLRESLERNHAPLPRLEYEDLFADLHKLFNTEEKELCELMRGITTGSLFKHNKAIADLIEANPQFKSHVPEVTQLQDHLSLWLDKYKARLEGREERPDVCLLYVGVEENKPFPAGIDDVVPEAIARLEQQSRDCVQ